MNTRCQIISLLLLLTLPILGIKGQNYVPNYSFENTIACPNLTYDPVTIDQIRLNVLPWSSFHGSVDLMDTCEGNTSAPLLVSDNFWGHQTPFQGTKYVAIAHIIPTDTTMSEYSELIGCELLDHLIVGERYHVEFHLSKADTVDKASNHVGLLFLNRSYDAVNDPMPFPNRCSVCTDSVITNESGWVTVADTFLADSAYTHIVLGYLLSHSILESGLGDSLYWPICCNYFDYVCGASWRALRGTLIRRHPRCTAFWQ